MKATIAETAKALAFFPPPRWGRVRVDAAVALAKAFSSEDPAL
jgi:hypothetical protein